MNFVYNDDYRNVTDLFPSKFFKWAICDIPYGLKVDRMPFLKNRTHPVKQKNGNLLNANKNKKIFHATNWDTETPDQTYLTELERVSENQIIFGVDYVDWETLGKGRIKWVKGFAEGVSFKGFERAYCSCIDHEMDLPLLWAGMMQAKNIDEPMTQQGDKKLNEKRIHPTHKPVMLYDLIYKTFDIKDCRILDTHVGSGSHRQTAFKNNCDFVGAEISPIYWQDQEIRFKNFAE
jgi:site-specific DNA-methyltransferase (adenine-specific)